MDYEETYRGVPFMISNVVLIQSQETGSDVIKEIREAIDLIIEEDSDT